MRFEELPIQGAWLIAPVPAHDERGLFTRLWDKAEFAAETAFGEPASAADRIVFHGDRKLLPGHNSFWLSCRLQPAADLSHCVGAACMAIETSAGKLVPRDDSPGVRHRIGIALRKHNDDGVHTYRIPALATTPRGTVLCVYDMRRRMSRDLQTLPRAQVGEDLGPQFSNPGIEPADRRQPLRRLRHQLL